MKSCGNRQRVASVGAERSSLLRELARTANLGHRSARSSAAAAVSHAVAAGEALSRARDLCDDGEWTRWIRRNFDASLRTAQRYVRLARNWPELGTDATRVSPRSQAEASRAIRQALFGRARIVLAAASPNSDLAPSETLPVTIASGNRDTQRATRDRIAAAAIAGLERLAASLRAAYATTEGPARYVIGRIDALAVDIRLDAAGESGEAAAGQVLYFAEAIGADRVKIGIAKDAQARLASMQTASAFRLQLLATVTAGRELESAIHARLSDYHIGGEWFHLAKPVRALIDRIRRDCDAACSGTAEDSRAK